MQLFFRLCFPFVVGLFLTAIPAVIDGVFQGVSAQSVDFANTSQLQQQVQKVLLDNMQPTGLGPPATWSKSVDRIQVQGKYAVAHWAWGENAGGWALLQNVNGSWAVLTRRSDAITPQVLSSFGVPSEIAQLLTNAYDPNWNNYQNP